MKMVDKKEEDGSELSELSHRSRSSAFTPPPEFVVQLSAADAASEDLFKPEPRKVKKVDLRVVLAQAEADNKFYSIENELFEQHIMRISAKAANEARLRMDEVHSDEEGDTVTDLESDSGASRSSTRSRASRAWAKISSTDFTAVEGLRKAHLMFRSSSFSISDFSRTSRDPSKARARESVPFRALSNEEKIQIARIETRLVRSRIASLYNDSERTLDDLQALYEEAEIRVGRARRDRADLWRDVLSEPHTAAKRARAGSPVKKPSAEKVLRFLEQKMKDARISIKKIKCHNEALQVAIVKTEHIVEEKQDIKDLLQAVDFEQMAIFNKQTLANLRSHAHEIKHLKHLYTTNSKSLLNLQNQLSYLDGEVGRVAKTRAERTPHIAEVQRELNNGKATIEKLQEELHQMIMEEIHGAGQPHVLEYMHVRLRVHELHQLFDKWRRKVEIKTFTLGEINKKISILKKKASVIVNPIAYDAAYAALYFHNQMHAPMPIK